MRVVQIKTGFSSFFAVQDKRTILVDTGNVEEIEKKLADMSSAGIDKKDVSLILLTHGHYDHYGNAVELRELTGAPIAMHKLDSEWVMKGTRPRIKPYGFQGRFMVLMMRFRKMPKPPILKPDIIFEGEVDLKPYGVDAKVIHTPGHTPGSVSVITASDDAIVGDLLFGSLSNPKKVSSPRFVDDLTELKKSIRLVLSYKPKVIYAAHADPLDPDEVKRFFKIAE